jgi:hypothetical protein
MTLISFMGQPEMRKKVEEYFPFEKIQITGKIRVLPNKRNQLIGIALDYLLRCFIQFHNKNNIQSSRQMIPPKFNRTQIREMYSRLKNCERYDDGRKKYGKYDKKEASIMKFTISMAEDSPKFSKYNIKNYDEFQRTGEFTKEFLISAIILAQWDLILKSFGTTHPSLLNFKHPDDVDDETIDELKELTRLFKFEMFKSKNPIHLNPEFGIGSKLVNGAAADLILNDTLIDIKTTPQLTFSIAYYRQLIGYWILSKIGKVNQSERIQINNIGIYFARHGILKIIPLKQFENLPSFTNFINWFEDFAINTHSPLWRLEYKCAKKANRLTKSAENFTEKYNQFIEDETKKMKGYCVNYFKIKKEENGIYETYDGQTTNTFNTKNDAMKKGIELQDGTYWIEVIDRRDLKHYSLVGIVQRSGKFTSKDTHNMSKSLDSFFIIGRELRHVVRNLDRKDKEILSENSYLDQIKPISGHIGYF